MNYYAYYSATCDLTDSFTDDFILYMEAYYPGYGRIFHNTEDHHIRIINGSRTHTLELNPAIQTGVLKKAIYDQGEETINIALLKKLADTLSKGSTIVFKDILSLGSRPQKIQEVYEHFMAKGIHMCFVSGSAMDSSNILALSSVMSTQISKYLQVQITAYCQEVERQRNIPKKLTDRPRKEKKELL